MTWFSELPLANTLTGADMTAVVQDGQSKRVPISGYAAALPLASTARVAKVWNLVENGCKGDAVELTDVTMAAGW